MADSPWPLFRRDHRNSGYLPLTARYAGDNPWAFKTGKGIFSTPVLDNLGNVFFGSADHFFYALQPDGALLWKFQTGEIIDSAAAMGAYDPNKGFAPLTFISGDGYMYQVNARDGTLIWKYQAELRPEISFNRWFEGNVAVGSDGTLYAGNTNFLYYALNPDGSLKWTYPTGSNNWSQAAFADDGTIFWGSVDTFVRAVSPEGRELWKRRTLGFVAASAAIGSDGTLYIGSFDSNLYALEPNSGKMKWKFGTRDHIYSSAALGQDAQGNTRRIYFGSADGSLYALDPAGRLRWRYETGAPIRSSPAVGWGPDGMEIVYFGCGDGKLYAINGEDGSFRWSFDTTPNDPELADRNDLNGSPALGLNGIYIGGEHGFLWYLPYDYPFHAPNDPRAATKPASLPTEGVWLEYMSPGGNALPIFPETLSPATSITLRLRARQDNQPLDARFCNHPWCPPDATQVTIKPETPFTCEPSADGRYLHIIPTGFLQPGQSYRLAVHGRYTSGGLRLGNLSLGGQASGWFEQDFEFKVAQPDQAMLPVHVGSASTTALEWTRLAAPLPSMLPSLNQIGFDYMDWVMGAVLVTEPDANQQGQVVLWAIGARRDEFNRLAADPQSDFMLPLSGCYQQDAFILRNRDFNLAITGIRIPFNSFELRGQLSPELVVRPGAGALADARVLSIPNFGPKMVIAGLANQVYKKLLVFGTYITRPLDPASQVNKRPAGIRLTRLDYLAPRRFQDGLVRAVFQLAPGATYPQDNHRAGILLLDADKLEAVTLDYHRHIESTSTEDGQLESVALKIPAGTRLPDHLRCYVMLDVYPFYQQIIQKRRE